MKNKPHSLDIGLTYKIGENKTKVTNKSSLEGWLVFTKEDGKTEIRLPMRSFVANLLTRLNYLLTGTFSAGLADYVLKSTVSAYAGSTDDAYSIGIVHGYYGTPNVINQSALLGQWTKSEYTFQDVTPNPTAGVHYFTAPYASGDTLKTSVRRTYTNISNTQIPIEEIGIITHRLLASTAGVGNLLISRDVIPFTAIGSTSSKQLEVVLKANRDSTGGIVLNFLRILYNLYLKGVDNSSPYKPRIGVVAANFPNASTASLADKVAANHFVINGTSGKFYGIVVGKEQLGELSVDQFNMPVNAALAYGANTVSGVTIYGSTARFTVSRDIVNNSSTPVQFTHIGLLTKGSGDPSALQNDQILIAVNKVSEEGETLLAGQTLKVEYTFEVQV